MMLATLALALVPQVMPLSNCEEMAFVSPAPGPEFGSALAIEGSWAFVGARGFANYSGAVHAFQLVNGIWIHQQMITPDPPVPPGTSFGCGVAVSGGTLLIGAFESNLIAPGKAYVFDLDPVQGFWSQTATLTAPDLQAHDEFGTDVAIDGDLAVVGARYSDGACPTSPDCNSGSAYVFARSGSTWTIVKKLVASTPLAGDEFGASVGISGDFVIVGAPADYSGSSSSGSAYVFDGAAGYAETALIPSFPLASGDGYGQAVAVSGSTAVVAAWKYAGTGIGVVFERSGTTWVQTASLAGASAGAELGRQLDVEGDLAVLGAMKDSGTGRAYVYARGSGEWPLVGSVVSASSLPNDFFGSRISIFGPRVLIGAMDDHPDAGVPGSPPASGKAFIFRVAAASEESRLGFPPNPEALKPGASSPPIIGAIWDPWIDLAALPHQSTFNFMAVAPTAINSPSVFGTILSFPQVAWFSAAAGTSFAIPIPVDCALVGQFLSCQGVAIESPSSIVLTNALDIVIGSF